MKKGYSKVKLKDNAKKHLMSLFSGIELELCPDITEIGSVSVFRQRNGLVACFNTNKNSFNLFYNGKDIEVYYLDGKEQERELYDILEEIGINYSFKKSLLSLKTLTDDIKENQDIMKNIHFIRNKKRARTELV